MQFLFFHSSAGEGKRLKREKIGERAIELAFEGNLIAKQNFLLADAVRRAEKRQERAGVAADAPMLSRDAAVHGGLLRSPDARLAPASHGHGLHQRDLGCGARLAFVHEGREKFLKTVRGFFFKNDGLSEQSVAGAVAGRIALALRSDGASGKGSVGSRCLNLFIGSHKRIWPQINADGRG